MIDVLHDWKRRPSEFGLCDEKDDLAVMVAYNRDTAKMIAYESETRELEMNAKRKRK